MMKQTKFDFNDILITPVDLSDIESRGEVDIRYNKDISEKTLPIFAAPMDTVISCENYKKFLDLGINICLPRGLHIPDYRPSKSPYLFNSYGLDEFSEILSGDSSLQFDDKEYVLLDIANGHMKKVYQMIKDFKKRFPEKILMVGNIANPKTYELLSQAGADFVRVGIGNGAGCLTTQQTGVGYPMASLVNECFKMKNQMKGKPAKIVADGGFKDYSDIIKALALGADFVMVGSVLNKCIDSAGDSYLKLKYLPKFKISQKLSEKMHSRGYTVIKKFRGMSTKEVQKKWGKSKLKTSEGVTRYRKAEYTLEGWTKNLTDYMKSNMSYCGCEDLEEYIGKVDYVFITQNAYKRFNK